MSTTAVPVVREEGEGERRWFAGGGVHTMKATAEETDGAFMLLENRMVQGKTTPLHIHPNLDETLIVLEGEILVYAAPTGLASGQLLSATPTLYRSSVRLRSRWPRRVPLLPDPRVIAGN